MTRQYQVILHSQMGSKCGTLKLEDNGQRLTGILCLLNFENQVQGEWIGERRIRLSHLIRSVVSDHECVSTFQLVGDTLSGATVTSRGVVMPCEGKIIQTEDVSSNEVPEEN